VAVLRQPALTVSIISRVIVEQAGAAAVLINCAEVKFQRTIFVI
jgi:hypothetical protein